MGISYISSKQQTMAPLCLTPSGALVTAPTADNPWGDDPIQCTAFSVTRRIHHGTFWRRL